MINSSIRAGVRRERWPSPNDGNDFLIEKFVQEGSVGESRSDPEPALIASPPRLLDHYRTGREILFRCLFPSSK
jgi:hypothetical protein